MNFGKVFTPGIGSVAMVLSVIAVPVVSMLTKKYDSVHIAKVFGNEQEKNVA